MEPITHFLTGACLGRSGFNRRTAYATLAMTLAAEAPDLDVLWGFRGPVAAFEHHRGITHTLLGAPFVALAVTGVVWVFHRLRRGRPPIAPRWTFIWLFAWIAALSHIFLDWTNDYGVRPFFPFNPRWYSLDIVFIFEPILFAVLLLGLVVPAILGLADREIGAKRVRFPGRGWAIAALSVAAIITAARWTEHQRALNLVANTYFGNSPVMRSAAEPYAVTPFHWFAIAETVDFFRTASVDTRSNTVEVHGDPVFKPPVTPAVLAAKRSWLGRVYLDWAKFPVATDRGSAGLLAVGVLAPSPLDTAVEFRDLRFAYPPLPGMSFPKGSEAPLSAWVFITPGGTVDSMVVGNRVQK